MVPWSGVGGWADDRVVGRDEPGTGSSGENLRRSATSRQSPAVKTDGTLWFLGWNLWGQLGDGTTTDRLSPGQVGTDTHWTSVAAGYYHTIALR